MSRKATLIILLVLTAVFLAWRLYQRPDSTSNEVVVYVATDQDIAEPILNKFEEQSGIRVKPVYDTESTKSVGLVNKLMAEKNNPQADVFWNNEVSRTIALKEDGVLAPYDSPEADGIPDQYIDDDHEWTGFSARARVLIYNTNLLAQEMLPGTLNDLLDPKWEGKIGLANPLFGSTTSYMISLFTVMGDDAAREYLTKLSENTVVLEGNSMVRDQVAAGVLPIGFTDTDDVNEALESGEPVAKLFLGQNDDGLGTVVFPNSVMLIKDAPNEENGKKLIDFLVSVEAEELLAQSRAVQMPLHPDAVVPDGVLRVSDIKSMNVDWQMVADKSTEVQTFLQDLFIK